MRSFPNIESKAWRRNGRNLPVYAGYGGGAIWYVTRESRRHKWSVWPAGAAAANFRGAYLANLVDVSNFLATHDK